MMYLCGTLALVNNDSLPSAPTCVLVNDSFRQLPLYRYHGLFMWLTLRIFAGGGTFDNRVVLIPCAAAAVISVVPVIPSFLVALPHALSIWWLSTYRDTEDAREDLVGSTAGLLDALLFFGLHLYVYWEISPRIYASMHTELPYFLVSMSVVGGIVFTGLSGAIVGPLILSGFLCTVRLVQMHHAFYHR